MDHDGIRSLFAKSDANKDAFTFGAATATDTTKAPAATKAFTFGFTETDAAQPEEPDIGEMLSDLGPRFGFNNSRFGTGHGDREEGVQVKAVAGAPAKRKKAGDDSSSDDDFVASKDKTQKTDEWYKFKNQVSADARNKSKSAKQNARKNSKRGRYD